MGLLTNILSDFWKWSGIGSKEFSITPDPSTTISPFYFPYFYELRNTCRNMINTSLSPQDVDDFLTCMALDSEEEIILNWCIEFGSESFIDIIVRYGCIHLQSEARWQIAELIRSRYKYSRMKYLQALCNDTNSYVQKRARNVLCELSDKID